MFPEIPTINFYPKEEFCEICGTKLNVLKTQNKTIIKMDIGKFYAKETVLYCPKHNTVYNSKELKSLAPYRCNFGYDVMVYVGKCLFIQCLSEQEIINRLLEKNIIISDREISYLGKKFIIYLALAHQESREKIKSFMSLRGGYILHLDGTCEGDSPHLFTGLDGITELVLENIKIPSEKNESITPFLKKIKQFYGNPIALVHDMGKGILSSIQKVFPGIPDFICHFHFLRDIGKDLLNDEYTKIRNSLKKHRIRSLLRYLAKSFEKIIDTNMNIVNDLKSIIENGEILISSFQQLPVVTCYVLIHWALDVSNQMNGYGFPFDQPHLLFYQNVKVIHRIIEKIINTQRHGEKKDYKPFNKLNNLLNNVISDKTLSFSVAQMEEKALVFDILRKALRIALPEGKEGLNDNGDETDMNSIEKNVKEFKNIIISDKKYKETECKETGCLNNKAYKNMINQIDKYWNKLFVKPIKVDTPNGVATIYPQRTNNISERLFRYLKRNYRKKSGISSLSKVLKAILADTLLVKNLGNKEYLDIILNGHNTLEARFTEINSKFVWEEIKKSKNQNEKLSPEMKKIINLPDLPQNICRLFSA